MSDSTLFSNFDYYKNGVFQYLMLNFNRYVDYDGDASKQIMDRWSEDLKKDFYKFSNQWRLANKNKTEWRKDLR